MDTLGVTCLQRAEQHVGGDVLSRLRGRGDAALRGRPERADRGGLVLRGLQLQAVAVQRGEGEDRVQDGSGWDRGARQRHAHERVTEAGQVRAECRQAREGDGLDWIFLLSKPSRQGQ